jgi:hypothetical protein
MVRISVALPELDAITAGRKLLARELEKQTVLPNDGDLGDVLTSHGSHLGLSADTISDLSDRIGDAPIQQMVGVVSTWSDDEVWGLTRAKTAEPWRRVQA